MSVIIRYQVHCLEFPQELSDHVFETLRNDSLSLKHCSLVCRAWLHATRSHLFRQVILTPQNIDSFTLLVFDSRSTIYLHVKKLEVRNIVCSNRLLANFTPALTHLHLRNITFNAFIDILDIICSFPYLQSIALDDLTVESGSVGRLAHLQTKILPSSVNSVRCRASGCLRTLLLWLLHHNNVPKLSNLDVGPIEEETIFEMGKYVALVGPVMRDLSFYFNSDHDIHNCTLHDYDIACEPPKIDISPISKRYRALFGIETCVNLAKLTGLQSLRLDNFIHFDDRIQGNALVWGPRIVASNRSSELREVVLGVSLRRAGELDRFNIRWDFFDEAFASIDGPYANLACLKFEITGTVNMDGIENLIRSRLPGCETRGLLQFCKLERS